MSARLIIPSITSIKPNAWRTKIAEIEQLGIRQVALFVTGLSEHERAECFSLLKSLRSTFEFSIPFVHAVASMTESEFCFLCDYFGTQAFNLHSQSEYPLKHKLGEDVKKKIYIENTTIECAIPQQDLLEFGGICFDLSHLEDSRRSCFENYQRLLKQAQQFQVGANHISAVSHETYRYLRGYEHFSTHVMQDHEHMRYPARLDPIAFAPICAIELENSLEEQLKIIGIVEAAMLAAEEKAKIVAA